MAEHTGISWTDHTFNIAWGCTRISPGCKNCYADRDSRRYGWHVFGTNKPRRVFGARHWAEPLRWNAQAEREGRVHRVFCSSMCDVFEAHPVIDEERLKLWPLIRETPWLDWQILTKRAYRMLWCLPEDWGSGYPNVWLGVSVENQEWANRRIPWLMDIAAAVKFVSYEPALGPVDLRQVPFKNEDGYALLFPLAGMFQCDGCNEPSKIRQGGIDWVIAGGESGPGFRPADTDWFRSMRDQCRAANTPFFFKQSGGLRPGTGIELDGEVIQEMPEPRTVRVAL